MKKQVQATLIWIAALTFVLGSLDAQDLKITYKTKVGAMMMSQKSTEVEYHSKYYKRTNNENEKRDTLIDYRNLVRYEIDHKKKVMRRITQEDTLKAVELQTAEWQDMMDADTDGKWRERAERYFDDKSDLSVKRLGIEKIVGKNCEKTEITLAKLSYKTSADPNLVPPAPQDALEKMDKMEYSVFTIGPMMNYFGKFFEAISKIKGVSLKSEMLIPIGPITIKQFREATEVVLDPIPESVFELPKGYKEEDAGKKELEKIEKALAENKKKRLAKKSKSKPEKIDAICSSVLH